MPKWTPEKEEILRRYYPTRGARGCQKYLPEHSIGSIEKRAQALGIRFAQKDGFVTCGEIARETGVPHQAVIEYFVNKNVAKKIGNRWIVPEREAIEYIESRRQQREYEKLRQAGYMSTKDTAKALSIGLSTVKNWVNGVGWLATRFGQPRHFRGLRGAILIHPIDVERVRVTLEKDRRQARQMKALKSLALDEGLKKATAAHRYSKKPSIKTIARGKIMRFFDLEAQDD